MLYILRQRPRGQVVIEYVLLLVSVVAIALIMLQLVEVGSSDESGGGIISYWRYLATSILQDQ